MPPTRAALRQVRHSITSPRMRNFAIAMLDTKPRIAITSAGFEVERAARADAEVSTSSIALTYMASRHNTRSCARGPRTMRYT